ncbi:MAG: hypothetical protein ACR2RE_29200, partial [Geminicoccaceae bacterium]
APRQELQYPYIIGAARDDHALILEINNIVPYGLPADLRADVCQDMILAVLEGKLELKKLKSEMKNYLRIARKRSAMPWNTVSIDAPLWDDGRTMHEIISENRLYD